MTKSDIKYLRLIVSNLDNVDTALYEFETRGLIDNKIRDNLIKCIDLLKDVLEESEDEAI